MTEASLLSVKNLKKHFPIKSGLFLKHTGNVYALDGASFELKKGETLGIVGESGCGKSTLGKTIIRLHDPTEGEVVFDGKDLSKLRGQELRSARRDIQMIFQDPFASLDPRMTVGEILKEPLKIHNIGTPAEQIQAVKDLLKQVGLKEMHLNRYPHEFSGGQRQRISIARSIALKPKLIIADEPVSALDVSIQAQILNLLKKLQAELGLTIVFISHDLSVVEHMCDRIAVMYLGKIVEMTSREELFQNPKHPYTKALISAIPRPGQGKKTNRKILTGDVPSPINPPPGCTFHPRCECVEPKCKEQVPSLKKLKKNEEHSVSCLLYEEETV